MDRAVTRARSYGLKSFTFTAKKKGKVNTAAKTRFFHFSPVEAKVKYWASERDYNSEKAAKGTIDVAKAEEVVDEGNSSNKKKDAKEKKRTNALTTFLGAKHALHLTDTNGRVFQLTEYVSKRIN